MSMLEAEQLEGVIVPIVTPFGADGALDHASFERCLGALLQQSIQGIVLNGTTGEAPTVAWEEVETLIRTAKKTMRQARVNLPIIVGTGTHDTRSTVKRTAAAARCGADAALVVTPYYSRPSEAGVLLHYREAAEAGLPVIAYEVPARTGLRLSVDTIRRVLELDGIIGLKDSTPDFELIDSFAGRYPKPILTGDDIRFCAMLKRGAAGGILAAANVRTEAHLNVYRLAKAGRFDEAEAAFDRLIPLIRLLFDESNPAPVKRVLADAGLIDSDTLRLPMMPVSAELHQALRHAIKH